MNAKLNRSASVFGLAFRGSVNVNGDSGIPVDDQDVPAAKTGSLTTRTDNNTGTLTMASGHGITTGQRLDLYWTGGTRRGMTVGTVATNSVPIDLGAGDNLPLANTAIIAAVPNVHVVTFTGSSLLALFMFTEAYGQFVLTQSDDTEIFPRIQDVVNNEGFFDWFTGNGYTNPVSGSVGKLYLSHKDTTKTRKMRAAFLLP